MIVVDTSALYAIATREPDREGFIEAIATAAPAAVGAVTAFELHLVLFKRFGNAGAQLAETALRVPTVEIFPWDAKLVPIATDALRRFGGRPARLNFGDCMAYALAKHHNAPLLYKGGDFAATDIVRAI